MRRRMTETEILNSEIFVDKCRQLYNEFNALQGRFPSLDEMKEIANEAIYYFAGNGLDYVEAKEAVPTGEFHQVFFG